MIDRVFTNRTLNLRKIKALGLDMDHTLVRYNTQAFEALAYKGMLEKLVGEKNYPEKVLKLKFDFDSVIRGLILDSDQGNLLKVSRHGAIRASRHGTQMIDFHQQQKTYRGTYVDLGEKDFSAIDTAFSLSVAALYSQLVDLKDEMPTALPDYHHILSDIVEVMDMSHRDDSLKRVVRAELEKYIIQEPAVAEGLEKYKKHGKKVFIVTNSDFHYTKALLDYAITPFLKEHKDWKELFDFVITSARKPRFFWDKLNFLKVNPEDGTMTNYDADLVPGIYQGGCAAIFERSLGVHGEDILYIGDHIYGDIVRVKKESKWRTALVIEELDQEIQQMQKAQPIQDNINTLMTKKYPLEKELVGIVSKEIEEGTKDPDSILRVQNLIAELDNEISPQIRKIQSIFNPSWGELMRAGNEESYFAYQVNRFADIYMPYLSDLLAVSPRSYFRSHRRPLAHEHALKLLIEQV